MTREYTRPHRELVYLQLFAINPSGHALVVTPVRLLPFGIWRRYHPRPGPMRSGVPADPLPGIRCSGRLNPGARLRLMIILLSLSGAPIRRSNATLR